MKKVTFIVFIALNICLIILGIIMFFIKYTSAVRYAIVSLSACYIYFIGWLLGYDAGSIEQKAKNKPILYLPLDKPNEHDEIACIAEAQRIYNAMYGTPENCKKELPRDSKGRFIKRSKK